MTIKKYCLLSDGSIEVTHHHDGSLKSIFKSQGEWYMRHDVYAHNMILTMVHRVIEFSDSIEDLIQKKGNLKK